MSYRLYKQLLDDLISELQQASKPQNALATYSPSSNLDTRRVGERLNELLEDLTDFAESKGNTNLVRKLNVLSEKTSGIYGHSLERAELEAKALRIDLALRTYTLEKELAFNPAADVPTPRSPDHSAQAGAKEKASKRVFVVHGHDDGAVQGVCRLLEGLALEPVVLREQPNRGATIIEKFEKNSDVGFAVVLMTADDMGGSLEEVQKGNLAQRARQNVILELGYFVARLGRPRVAVLKAEGVEEPSDIMGIVYTPIDAHDAWRMVLGKELKAAGYEVDLNKL